MLLFQVESGGGVIDNRDVGSDAISTRFVVDKSTIIKFTTESSGDGNCTVELNNQSLPVRDAADLISKGETNDYSVCNQIFEDFGGYNKEVYDAISVTHLGLGLIGGTYFNSYDRDTNKLNESHISNKSSSHSSNVQVVDTQDGTYDSCQSMGNNSMQASLSTQLFKPPKGLLIHGPAGTQALANDEALRDSRIHARTIS